MDRECRYARWTTSLVVEHGRGAAVSGRLVSSVPEVGRRQCGPSSSMYRHNYREVVAGTVG